MKQEKPNEFVAIFGVAIVLAFSGWIFAFTEKKPPSYDPAATLHYIKSGSSSTNGDLRMLPTKVFHVTVTPTVANGGSLDISGFGLTTIANVQVSVTRNTTVPNDVPTVSLKAVSTTSVTYNLIQGNNAVVALLGINVLSGAPNVFVTTPTDCTLRFTITGY